MIRGMTVLDLSQAARPRAAAPRRARVPHPASNRAGLRKASGRSSQFYGAAPAPIGPKSAQ